LVVPTADLPSSTSILKLEMEEMGKSMMESHLRDHPLRDEGRSRHDIDYLLIAGPCNEFLSRLDWRALSAAKAHARRSRYQRGSYIWDATDRTVEGGSRTLSLRELSCDQHYDHLEPLYYPKY
jgi:hypothetical protein